jgi:hypothetical protein
LFILPWYLYHNHSTGKAAEYARDFYIFLHIFNDFSDFCLILGTKRKTLAGAGFGRIEKARIGFFALLIAIIGLV